MSGEDDLMGSFFDEIRQVEEDPQVVEPPVKRLKVGGMYLRVEDAEVIAAPFVGAAIETAVVASSKPVYTSYPNTTDKSGGHHDTDRSIASSYTMEAPSSSSGSTPITSAFNFVSSATVTTTRTAPPFIPRQNKDFVRTGGGDVWADDSLKDWPEDDYRLFVGDIAKEIDSDGLSKAFMQYKSFAKAKVIRAKWDNKARGYGFVSFLDPMDCAKALREQNGKYLGSRPMKISKSSWKERDIKEVQKKAKKTEKMKIELGLK